MEEAEWQGLQGTYKNHQESRREVGQELGGLPTLYLSVEIGNSDQLRRNIQP
jgi:hypothetical protein